MRNFNHKQVGKLVARQGTR